MQIGKAKMTITPPPVPPITFRPTNWLLLAGGRVQKSQKNQNVLLDINWGTCCKFLASARAQLKGEGRRKRGGLICFGNVRVTPPPPTSIRHGSTAPNLSRIGSKTFHTTHSNSHLNIWNLWISLSSSLFSELSLNDPSGALGMYLPWQLLLLVFVFCIFSGNCCCYLDLNLFSQHLASLFPARTLNGNVLEESLMVERLRWVFRYSKPRMRYSNENVQN